MTEWEQFRALDLKALSATMATPVVVDLRNIYSPDDVTRNGLLYCGVGRPQPVALLSRADHQQGRQRTSAKCRGISLVPSRRAPSIIRIRYIMEYIYMVKFTAKSNH